MKTIIEWKKVEQRYGSDIFYGYVAGYILFSYSYTCIDRKDNENPYLLRINIGINNHIFRFTSEKRCVDYAEAWLKNFKDKL